jgi:hypothetical protein
MATIAPHPRLKDVENAAKPTALAAGKVAALSLTAFGSAESDVIAAYAVEP